MQKPYKSAAYVRLSDCQICGDMANSNIRNRGINDRHDRIWTTEK